MYSNHYNNVINYPFIDYIIKSYVPELQHEIKSKKVKMGHFEEAMLHTTTKVDVDDKTYERLEFLGDTIFHMIMTEYLYLRYDQEAEGFLTRLRIRIERGDSMVELAKILELDYFVQIYGIGINDHILEDVFEAFIGAFYLNFGMKFTRIFIINLVEKHKNLAEIISHDDNYKDLLLRYFHQMKWGHPIYLDRLQSIDPPKKYSGSKSEKIFKKRKFISIVKNPKGKVIGKGVENSKKKAEQSASENALIYLGVISDGIIDANWLDKIEKVEKEEKKKTSKKPMSVYNPNNKLITRTNIKEILEPYNIHLPSSFKLNMAMFHEAMTHRSYIVRKVRDSDDVPKSKSIVKLQKKSNERLQFLGDAIIHFVISEFIYHKYKNADEGFLTRLRCKLENRENLFYLGKQTDIGSYVLVSQNIEILHGRNNVNIISGGLESFICAIYLQMGLKYAKEFILEVIRIELDIGKIAEKETNYKDLVLHLYNKNHWGFPIYRTVKEEGPDHSKMFTMGIYLGNKLVASGKASSKKKAEQIASKKMYNKYEKDS